MQSIPFLVCLMNTLKSLIKASSNLKLDLPYLIKNDKMQNLDKEVLFLKRFISEVHKKNESMSNVFVLPHYVASLYSVDIGIYP